MKNSTKVTKQASVTLSALSVRERSCECLRKRTRERVCF